MEDASQRGGGQRMTIPAGHSLADGKRLKEAA